MVPAPGGSWPRWGGASSLSALPKLGACCTLSMDQLHTVPGVRGGVRLVDVRVAAVRSVPC